ncbi:MAG: DUF2142 domain-containing protein [Marmoricola sp.]
MSQQIEVGPSPTQAPTPTSVPPRRAMLLGLCGLFAIWVLVMPPFAGSDEHDHAYRAAAAARGQWAIDPVDATRGTGAFLTVPSDIVDAARVECQNLIYTEDRDCVGKPGGEETVVASGAGRYHPLFYAVIGTAAKPFDGSAALYMMRIATALLSAAFVWMAARAAQTWARTRWPYLGIAVACTPVAIYSCTVAAPNGLEMMAALALWMSLIGLLQAPPEHIRRLAAFAAVSGAVLSTLRPMGPFWCLVTLGAVLLCIRAERGRVKELLRRPAVLAGAGLVLLSALQSTAWVLAVGALEVGIDGSGHSSLGHRMWVSAIQLPAWTFQTIAAFPLRDVPTHTSVYVCYLFLFIAVVALGLRAGHVRARITIVLLTVGVLLFPYVTTVNSYDRYGTAWQGRYALPVAMGIAVLAAHSLDRSGLRLRGPMQLSLFMLFVVAQTVSPAYTLLREIKVSPQVDTAAWVQPSLTLTIVLAGLSSALMWWGAFGQDLPKKDQVRAEA